VALVDLRTFEAITGPKRDKWLVRTVGILAAAIGTGLWTGLRRNLQPEVELIGVASAVGLAAIEAVSASRGVISRIYLIHAVIESALLADWVWSRPREPRPPW
jgi:hypothetical protein